MTESVVSSVSESRPPLSDIRVLSIEQYGAGPYATMHLAALGAEVIKIELPSEGGDIGRAVPPYADGGDSLFFQALNANKRSVGLDLTMPEGRRAFEGLVATCDVVFSNLRGDVPGRLGLTYEELKHLNPAIVCCSLSAYGMTGPRAAQPGYDYIIQALAGWMHLTGEPGSPPAKSGLSVVDWSTGLAAALAVAVGVHAARRDGVGCDCDISLFDVAISMLTYPASWWLNEGYETRRMARSAHPTLVPFQVMPASDGWLMIGCAKEKFWRRLVGVVNRPDLLDDPRFAGFAARDANRDLLIQELDTIFSGRPVDGWVAELTKAGIPCGAINDVGQALAEPQTVARDLIADVPHPTRGHVRVVRSPINVGTSARQPLRPSPSVAEHTTSILTDLLGYNAEQVGAVMREALSDHSRPHETSGAESSPKAPTGGQPSFEGRSSVTADRARSIETG